MRLPKLTTNETAEIVVIGLFLVSLIVFPPSMKYVLAPLVGETLAAQIVAIAVSLFAGVYIVSTAVTIWRGYHRPA